VFILFGISLGENNFQYIKKLLILLLLTFKLRKLEYQQELVILLVQAVKHKVNFEFEWWIDGKGTMKVKTGDIINVKKGTWHQITCISDEPAVRYAINWPDVMHVYEDDDE
jgi:hypothetical protein